MLPGLYAGLILGWMRERGESLWPCILLHNAMDSLLVAGSALLT
jgi:membrane protease YdiL (CAAX protease family)